MATKLAKHKTLVSMLLVGLVLTVLSLFSPGQGTPVVLAVLLSLTHLIGYHIGTAIVFVIFIGFLRRGGFFFDESFKQHSWRITFVPLLSNFYVALQSLIFLSYPVGSEIRPILWVLIVFSSCLALIIVSIIHVVTMTPKVKKKIFVVFAWLLSILPFVTNLVAFIIVIKVQGLILKD